MWISLALVTGRHGPRPGKAGRRSNSSWQSHWSLLSSLRQSPLSNPRFTTMETPVCTNSSELRSSSNSHRADQLPATGPATTPLQQVPHHLHLRPVHQLLSTTSEAGRSNTHSHQCPTTLAHLHPVTTTTTILSPSRHTGRATVRLTGSLMSWDATDKLLWVENLRAHRILLFVVLCFPNNGNSSIFLLFYSFFPLHFCLPRI